jgi:di/tricarboxylate transporter
MARAKKRRAAVVAKTRDKRREARARQTQRAQERAASRRLSPRADRARRTIGWVLVGLGVVVGVSHWLTHLGAWDFASQGIEDLVAGYPMAVLLGIGGAVVLSR